VVAHEAGHGSFSMSDTVNAIAGTILHTFLLVPFYSWKFTHAAHHGATNHLRKDQVFVPQTKVCFVELLLCFVGLKQFSFQNNRKKRCLPGAFLRR
jgi:fatty acid desaturase